MMRLCQRIKQFELYHMGWELPTYRGLQISIFLSLILFYSSKQIFIERDKYLKLIFFLKRSPCNFIFLY